MYNINDVLLSHVISGSGPAITRLRNSIYQVSVHKGKNNKYSNFVRLLESFFQARTDVRRLIYAQEAAEIILETHDMQELSTVRKILAELELSRIIKYKKQRDHTAHTLYLFLLGLWLYDSVGEIRESFASRISHLDPSGPNLAEWYIADIFILQWLYVGLLHDVGYIFSELGPNSVQYRKKIDELFEFRWLESELAKELAEKYNEEVRKALMNAYEKFTRLYCGGTNWPSKTADTENPLDIIERISYMPWIRDLGLEIDVGHDPFILFNGSNRSYDDLKLFAYNIAHSGYENGGAAVDHAVASGFLLLQYSTYWFWIINTIKQESKVAYDAISGEFSNADCTIIIEACRAVAYHNMPIDSNDKKFDIEEDPLFYLGILCDELSTWERFHASNNPAEIWAQRNLLESSDLTEFRTYDYKLYCTL
jgi:hypothetical protein